MTPLLKRFLSSPDVQTLCSDHDLKRTQSSTLRTSSSATQRSRKLHPPLGQRRNETWQELQQRTQIIESHKDFLTSNRPLFSSVQVMQLTKSSSNEATQLHLMILEGQWSRIAHALNSTSKNSTDNFCLSSSSKDSSLKASMTRTWHRISSKTCQHNALIQRDEFGRTPLFLILRRREVPNAGLKKAPVELIFEILRSCPEAGSIPDVYNNYPLHVAVINGHRENVVHAIIQCYPWAVTEKNHNLDTPLLLACNFTIAIQHEEQESPVVLMPSDSPKSAVYAKQEELNEPVCRQAFFSSKRWEIVALLLEHSPEAACIRNRNGMSALEMALQRHAPSHIIQKLINADVTSVAVQHSIVISATGDEGCRKQQSSGVVTPLSLAIIRDASQDVLAMLTNAFPLALGIRDEFGLTPLSRCWLQWLYAFSHNTGFGIRDLNKASMIEKLRITDGRDLDPELETIWLKMMSLLYALHQSGTILEAPKPPPDAVKFRAVHAIAAQDCPLDVLDVAILLSPSQVTEADHLGRLPLHLAAGALVYKKQYYEPDILVNSIDRLVKAYPAGALVADNRGLLPLHVALRSGKMWNEGLSSLVAAEPQVLLTPDPWTGLYPLMMAVYYYFEHKRPPLMLMHLAQNRVGFSEWNAMTGRRQSLFMSQLCHEEELSKLTSLFELLRAAPSIFSDESVQPRIAGSLRPSLCTLINEPVGDSEDENLDITTSCEYDLDIFNEPEYGFANAIRT